MTDDNIITNTGTLLPEERLKVAAARTISEWMEIYIEVIARTLEAKAFNQEGLKGVVKERFMGETIPRLKRIVRDFEVAGVTLHDEIDVSGIHLVPGYPPLWDDPNRPEVIFYWPDGQELKFQGKEALSAVGFFEFWQKHLIPIRGVKGGQRRIIQPGSAEEKEYFDAKNKDMQKGTEPDA